MKSFPSFAIVRGFALATLLVVCVDAGAHGATFTGLYAFGDSLSDLGNTYNRLGGTADDSSIYALVGYTAQPGRYDNGRWSNGPLWVEHLNNSLGLPTLQRNDGTMPLTSGTNFAWGGSTTGTGYTSFVVKNLQLQISEMLTLGGGSAPSTALYTVWSGGNDVINFIADANPNTPASIDAYTTTMASNINAALTSLYNAGARTFLAANLPALGDKPTYVNTPNQAFANSIVASYNPKLEQTLTAFRATYPDANLASWDVYTEFNDILANHGLYGFTNTEDAAFTDTTSYPGTVVAAPNTHVFWDGTHPTAPGHSLLGIDALEAINQQLVPEPSSLALVVLTIFAVDPRSTRRRAA